MNDKLTYLMDWTLSQLAFHDLVRELIHQAEKKHKVLALPMLIKPDQTFIDYLTLLLAQVDCQGCDAPCCRENPEGELTRITAPEYQRLAEKYGKEHFTVKNSKAFLRMPCPFLRKNRPPHRGDLCSIYPEPPAGVRSLSLSVRGERRRRRRCAGPGIELPVSQADGQEYLHDSLADQAPVSAAGR